LPGGKKRRIFATRLVRLSVGRIEGKPSLYINSVKAGRRSKREHRASGATQALSRILRVLRVNLNYS